MVTHPPRLLLASGNAHKRAELTRILDERLGAGAYALLTPEDFPGVEEPVEDGATFEANALIKARYWTRMSGLLTLADDSGLAVDALDGRPGVLSARYAATTAERNIRVLHELAGVPVPRRTARFVCVAALADPAGATLSREGTVEGCIAAAPRGAHGFGYDPIFELTQAPHAGRTMAELTEAEKDAISHRGRALAALAPLLTASLSAGRVGQ